MDYIFVIAIFIVNMALGYTIAMRRVLNALNRYLKLGDPTTKSGDFLLGEYEVAKYILDVMAFKNTKGGETK